jgi:hypothetical protein
VPFFFLRGKHFWWNVFFLSTGEFQIVSKYHHGRSSEYRDEESEAGCCAPAAAAAEDAAGPGDMSFGTTTRSASDLSLLAYPLPPLPALPAVLHIFFGAEGQNQKHPPHAPPFLRASIRSAKWNSWRSE